MNSLRAFRARFSRCWPCVLLFCLRFAWRKLGYPPVLIDIAVPLLIALTLIRLLVYGMRRLFLRQAWLKSSERAISFAIWGCVVLYFLGLLPEVANALDDVKIPIGARSTTLLEVAKGLLAIALTLTVTLWLSGAIERRLLRASHIDSNMRAVMSKFLRAVLLIVGVLIALQAIGFDMTLLTVFGGALGVGIGLGLAEARRELHCRLHHPARPLDSPGRHDRRRWPLWPW